MFQNAQLIDDRDALRNVSLGLVDTTVGPAEMEARSLASLATVGLNHLAQRPAALLSGGERQRVALARALVKMPELVIADEPTGALDRANGQAVLDLLFAQQTTILLVTHDRDAAARADEVITLIDGRLS